MGAPLARTPKSNSHSVDVALRELSALRDAPAAELLPALRQHLASKQNLVVAKAAEMTRDANLSALAPELAGAFARFMIEPAKSDRGCGAKEAIARALYELAPPGNDAVEFVFISGIHHRQLEGSYGPPIDTASALRGWCALGLVRIGYKRMHDELAELLADPEPQARIMAARAIAYAGHDTGTPLLRLKCLAGDREPEVLSECLLALGKLAGPRAATLITRFLDSTDESISATAALALGEMRSPLALAPLRARWSTKPHAQDRSPLLLPIALSRLPEAIDFLIEIIATAPEPLATEALQAMKMYRGDSATRERLRAEVESRGSTLLITTFASIFH